jgi:hypothetical protein
MRSLDPVFSNRLDPDPDSAKYLNPDPNSVNPDPKDRPPVYKVPVTTVMYCTVC